MIHEFHWVIDNALAGSGQPGRMQDMSDDIQFLQEQGFKTIVTLLEEPLELPDGHGFEQIHFPIVDMKTPGSPQQAEKYCSGIMQRIAQGEKVLLHCEMGTGRTGTILACCLVHQGLNGDEAIAAARKVESMYIRNQQQENFVKRYASYIQIKQEYNSPS